MEGTSELPLYVKWGVGNDDSMRVDDVTKVYKLTGKVRLLHSVSIFGSKCVYCNILMVREFSTSYE